MTDMLFFGILFRGPSPCQLDIEEVVAMSRQCILLNMAKTLFELSQRVIDHFMINALQTF